MSGSGTFPAIPASIGGKQRRLTLQRQWRRAILNVISDLDAFIFDQETAEQAIGFNFISFG